MMLLLPLDYVRAHDVAQFFEVRRREIRISSVTAMDVFIDTMNIQRQKIQKLRLQKQSTCLAVLAQYKKVSN